MQSNNKKLEDLSPFEIFQLSHYGNILNNADPDGESESNLWPREASSEEAYIFKLQNPDQ